MLLQGMDVTFVLYFNECLVIDSGGPVGDVMDGSPSAYVDLVKWLIIRYVMDVHNSAE